MSRIVISAVDEGLVLVLKGFLVFIYLHCVAISAQKYFWKSQTTQYINNKLKAILNRSKSENA